MMTLQSFRRIIWPIEGYENKKFIPMALMMCCILFNYSMLRSIKDGFVVTAIGAEALSFLKTYVVFPSAILMMLLYTKLCNIMKPSNIFYTMMGIFVGYFIIFGFILYPNETLVHADDETIERFCHQFPNFKWFIRIVGKWSFATFYTMAELWGSVANSLLFWQFANQITTSEEAKRFYSMFGLVGNCGLLLTSLVLNYFLDTDSSKSSSDSFLPIFTFAIISSCLIMIIYAWINKFVLTDPRLVKEVKEPKKSKTKTTIKESLITIFHSKYLLLITLLVVCYGISINLVEGVWKSKIRELYNTRESYTKFMGYYQAWQGIAAIIVMIIGSNILRKLSWKVAALLTPLMVLITGILFFMFIFFSDKISLHSNVVLIYSPLAIAVFIGTIQNILSKAIKYSLFDATKEMSYIPLDNELKSKGKAAVDVVGGRLGKSGGGIIQSTFFIIFPSLTFTEATPYFGIIFFAIVLIWIYVVVVLNKEYNLKLQQKSN